MAGPGHHPQRLVSTLGARRRDPGVLEDSVREAGNGDGLGGWGRAGGRLRPSSQGPKSSVFPDPEADRRISVCLRAHFP